MPPLEGNTESAAPASAPASAPTSAPAGPETGAAPEFDMDAALAGVEEGLASELRDDDDPGRTTNPAEKTADEAKVVAATKESTAPAATPPGAVDPNAPAAPDTWTKEAKEAWGTVPPRVQQEIIKREADIANGYREIGAHKNISETFQKVLQPYAGIIQKYGVDPWQNVSTLLNSQAKLVFGTEQEKLQVVFAAAEAAGIDLTKVIAGQREDVVDHRYVAMQQELRDVKANLGNVTGSMAQQKAAELEAGIWAFANDTSKAPHFWDVAADMAAIAEKSPNMKIEKIYEQAVWTNPVTRQKVIEAQTAAAQQNKATKDAEHARKSRAATSANVDTVRESRRGATTDDESLEDSIRASLKEIRSRA